jgi:hypothetical protein
MRKNSDDWLTGASSSPAAVLRWLKPLESATLTSSRPPPPCPLLRGGAEPPEPKPTYLPPWLGGSPSGFDAFSCAGSTVLILCRIHGFHDATFKSYIRPLRLQSYTTSHMWGKSRLTTGCCLASLCLCKQKRCGHEGSAHTHGNSVHMLYLHLAAEKAIFLSSGGFQLRPAVLTAAFEGPIAGNRAH